ncbi:hypothetical protein RclHR1_02590003 [Rhizophagus clarus]|uniref:Uncharacterized protein n=1 Tax=Rhizophagus clarus TaxID=94130 RepID=A0A2Z6RUK2_9GLOM|nr:hypothetical protein RclHR1_02590003 [Rhizophagus clarus]
MAIGRHAGLVRHILTNIKSEMKKRLDNKNYCLTWEGIPKYLNSKKYDQSIYSGCRAVSDVLTLNDPEERLDMDLMEESWNKHGKRNFIELVHGCWKGIIFLSFWSDVGFRRASIEELIEFISDKILPNSLRQALSMVLSLAV